MNFAEDLKRIREKGRDSQAAQDTQGRSRASQMIQKVCTAAAEKDQPRAFLDGRQAGRRVDLILEVAAELGLAAGRVTGSEVTGPPGAVVYIDIPEP